MPKSVLRRGLEGFHPYVPGEQPPDGAGWVKLNTNEAPLHPTDDFAELPPILGHDPTPLKFVVSPNSPTGALFDAHHVRAAVAASSGVVAIDEAYVDFAPRSALDLLETHGNVVLLRTFSKSYGLAGMRIGFALGSPDLIEALDAVKDSYNVDR